MSKTDTSLTTVNFLTGISDGLSLSFAASVIACALFINTPGYVIATGLTVTMIGALAFGWARYAAELAEINHNHPGLSGKEKTKDQALLQHIGIEAKVRESIAIATEKEKQQWLQEIRGNNMDWEYPDKKRAARGGWQLGLGFMAGGILTALPFYVVNTQRISLLLPVLVFLLALGITAFVQAGYTGKSYSRTIAAKLATGIMAGLAAALISGFLFRHKEKIMRQQAPAALARANTRASLYSLPGGGNPSFLFLKNSAPLSTNKLFLSNGSL